MTNPPRDQGPELTFWCLRHQQNELVSNAPCESHLRGVLWVDRCEAAGSPPVLETPNEPDERLEPIYAALRRMGKELAELQRQGPPKPPQGSTGKGATDA